MPPKDICPNQGAGMKLLILVTTAPSHGKQREAVRGTWGHVAFRRDVGFAFMVGTSTNPQDNQAVEAENLIYGDVIQVISIVPWRYSATFTNNHAKVWQGQLLPDSVIR